jgi:hypothetical protein
MADINTLVEELSKLTVLEAADLVKKLERSGACPPQLLWLWLPLPLRAPLLRLLRLRRTRLT